MCVQRRSAETADERMKKAASVAALRKSFNEGGSAAVLFRKLSVFCVDASTNHRGQPLVWRHGCNLLDHTTVESRQLFPSLRRSKETIFRFFSHNHVKSRDSNKHLLASLVNLRLKITDDGRIVANRDLHMRFCQNLASLKSWEPLRKHAPHRMIMLLFLLFEKI